MKATNKEKKKAQVAVKNAIKSGKLIRRRKCTACKDSYSRITAHHFDYGKPLEVVWLCAPCHTRWHTIFSGVRFKNILEKIDYARKEVKKDQEFLLSIVASIFNSLS